MKISRLVIMVNSRYVIEAPVARMYVETMAFT